LPDKIIKPLRLALLATLAIAGPALSDGPSEPPLKSGIDVRFIDHDVRPQDDFYRYVNGGWLERNPIPDDAVRVSAASQVNDRTRGQLQAIVEGAQAADPADADQRRIAMLYASFMDEPAAQRLGLRPLRDELARIEGIRGRRRLALEMGRLGCIGVRVPVGNSVLNDSRDAGAYIQDLHQWGLGLPGREYYLGQEPGLGAMRSAYVEHVRRMLERSGDRTAPADARAVLALETSLARAQWSIADSSDPVKTDNRYTLQRLQALAPGLDWKSFLSGNESYGRMEQFVVAEPSYFQALAGLAAGTPLPVWRAYLRYQLLSAYAPYLDRAFVDEGFAFEGGQLRGIPANSPRWKRGLDLVEESMGEALGRLYVARYISPQAKARVTAMVGNFVAAFDQDLDGLDWMGPETRQRARQKLLGLRAKIGWPDRWRDYGGLRIAAGDLVGNVRRARQWEYRRNLAKLGRPVDRDEWYMTPQTPDAYEWLPQNEIVIGAALLQPPFFDPDADDAVNYGAIGGTIGHEMSHGFDNIGSQYDARGTLLGKPGWFTPQDQQRFDALTHALTAQYSAFEPLPGYRVDGEQTLSENIADVAGAAIAWRAYRLSLGGRPAPVIDGLGGEQRFFMGWAQRRRGNYRDKELIRIIKSDEHAPPAVRAVAPLMNLEAFCQAFGIKPGDRMYLPPERRVRIW
jgi:predicted metalloendopeptidase